MIARTIITAILSCGLYQVTMPTLVGLLALSTAYLLYVFWVFKKWNADFSGHRINRGHKHCPSNRMMPPVKSLEENKKSILHNSKYHANFDGCELLNDVKDMAVTRKENQVIREIAKRSNSLRVSQKGFRQMTGPLLGDLNMVEEAEELDMDHIYISFTDFLWGFTFIGPFSYFLWKYRTIVLRIRQFLLKHDLIKPMDCDYEEVCATLLLEQTQAIHYCARTEEGSKLGNIAGFFFVNFPYVDNDCKYQVADLFAVDIDLDTKRFKKAKLDDLSLNAKETLILLWFNTIAAEHVKLHAMANWGVNVDETLANANPLFRQSSVTTVMYNYFGYTSFNGFFKTWTEEGLASPGWAKPEKPLIQCFNHGIRGSVWQHGERLSLAQAVGSETDEVTAPFHSKFAPTEMRQLVLVAHNNMKPAMKQFIETYSEILKKFRVTGTQTTMKMCKSMWGEDDPSIHYGLTCTSGPLGGDAQIAALMCMEDLGGMIFFIDPLSAHPHQADIDSLQRLANCGNIIVCCNPASASSMMYTLRAALTKGSRGMIPSFFETLESPAVEEYKHQQAVALANVIKGNSPSAPAQQAVEPASKPKEEKKVMDVNKKGVSFGEDDVFEVDMDEPGLSDTTVDQALMGQSMISGAHLEALLLLDSDSDSDSDENEEGEDTVAPLPTANRRVSMGLFGIKSDEDTTTKGRARMGMKKLGKSVRKMMLK